MNQQFMNRRKAVFIKKIGAILASKKDYFSSKKSLNVLNL